jgi:hypothetical protein
VLGNEILTADTIVKHVIHAPLVFLSACNTAPTYGTINSIANAFFETGSLTVTTTYLPINVNSGSVLYLRLLNNLQMVARDGIHQNWLAFLSHLIRTSIISDTFQVYAKSKKPQPNSRKHWPLSKRAYIIGLCSLQNAKRFFMKWTKSSKIYPE